jgi:radical SAM enzyme (TIGR01210 family)
MGVVSSLWRSVVDPARGGAPAGEFILVSTSQIPLDLDRWIEAQRPARNVVDPWRPYAWSVEPEHTTSGNVEDVATVFLTNRECPFRCLMCDLWKNTTAERVPDGAIVAQLDWALERLSHVMHIKLYNAGNFFDAQAIPPGDLKGIAQRLAQFETVIVECHPRLIDERCLAFREMLKPELQVAMGLETVHPDVLPRLNKRMTLPDFERAVQFLREHDIGVRAFTLLRPPFLDESEGVEWAKRSLDYAFSLGVECCVVIPTRAGNGAMEILQAQGEFSPPQIKSLEKVLEYGISMKSGRVFGDLWDIEKFAVCGHCDRHRAERIRAMNLTQELPAAVRCEQC